MMMILSTVDGDALVGFNISVFKNALYACCLVLDGNMVSMPMFFESDSNSIPGNSARNSGFSGFSTNFSDSSS